MSPGKLMVSLQKDGCCRRGITRLFVSAMVPLLLLMPVMAATRPLLTPPELARAGTPSLALRLLEQQQPDFSTASDDWLHWKRLQVKILRETGRWERMLHIDQSLPEGLPAAFLDWLATQRAEAMLELERPADARAELLKLIWFSDQSELLEQWRHLITRSYLAQGAREDAYAAMLRYRHDYGTEAGPQRLLAARVFLGSNRPAEALPLLIHLEGNREAQGLLLLARLRSGESSKSLRETIEVTLAEPEISEGQLGLFWAIKTELEQRDGNLAAYLIAMEKALQFRERVNLHFDLFDLHVDHLWQAYFDYADRVANREQLLIGSDQEWFAAAESAGKVYPVKRRSLYAWLSRYGQTPALRERAHALLLDALQEGEESRALIGPLYLTGSAFTQSNLIPEQVRYYLAGVAISRGDLTQASWLMRGLERPPEGVDPFLWQLRRARVFTLAGQPERGSEILSRLMAEQQGLSRDQIDLLVKNMFDLQTIGEHEEAYRLLRALSLRVSDEKQLRELCYWMADSRLAQKRFAEAGQLYLQSAILPGLSTMDPWAQTARYQAARALMEGGLHDDAKRLYQQLLKVTQDPARRAVLLRDIERLPLYQTREE